MFLYLYEQGPFRSDEMRQWLEAGYFKGDLPISQQASGPFIPLSAIFPDLSVAFQTQQTDTAQEEAASRARAEEERRRAEELEKQRLAEQEAREAAERQRREMAAAASKQNEDSQNQSAQLKMMLGLSSQQQQQQQQQPTQPEAAPAPAEKPKAAEKQPTEKRPSKAEKSNNKQKKEFAPVPAPAEEAPKVPAPTAKPATPAWGGAAQVAPATRKSMSDIQKEEARRAAQLAAQQGNQPRQSSGWANVAAAGKSSWTPSAVKPTAAAVVGANAAAVVNARAAGQSGGARPNRQPTPTGQQRKAGTQPQQTQRTNSKSSTAEEFGASMSPQLESWCKDQMQKLNGTDDLTLVAFCMTLSDPSEIRQYLTTYLGSTPQVNKFANEFISKKGGGGSQQEEWETPGSAKKGKKKKAR